MGFRGCRSGLESAPRSVANTPAKRFVMRVAQEGWSRAPDSQSAVRSRVLLTSQPAPAAAPNRTMAHVSRSPGGVGAIAHADCGWEPAGGGYSPLPGRDVQLPPNTAGDLLASWRRGCDLLEWSVKEVKKVDP